MLGYGGDAEDKRIKIKNGEEGSLERKWYGEREREKR